MLDFLSKYRYIVVSSCLFGVLSLALIINSGYHTCVDNLCTYYFSEWQMHDALWHISLAKLAFNDLPFSNPFHAGSTLAGYNYFIDLVLYLFTKLGIEAINVYFVVLPVIAVLLYLHSTWLYFKEVCKSNYERILSIFFLYFGTGLSYFFTLYTDQSLSGATLRGFPVVTSLYPFSMMLNLPYAFSLPLIVYVLIYLSKKSQPKGDVYLAIAVFLAFGLKFYAGIVIVLLLLFNLSFTSYIRHFFVIFVPSLAAYLLFYRGSMIGFPFAFDPLALTHVIIDDVHLFYNQTLTLARYHLYENISGFPLRLVAIETFTLFLFFFINWGTRLIGYIIVFTTKTSTYLTKSLLLISLGLGLIPVFFIQKGGWYNTMQFMYYSIFLLSLATVKLLSQLELKKPRMAIILALLITLPLIPNSLEQFTYYFKPKNVVSSAELTALEALRNQQDGVVHVNRPWAKRAIIPVFAEKQMYYLDSDQLMLMLPSHVDRLNLIRQSEGGSIHQIPADYFFIYKNEVASEDAIRSLGENPNLRTIFENDQIRIFGRFRPGVTIN